MTGQILDVPSLSKMLGISEKTLYSRVARGQIPYRRWGGRIIFIPREIEEFFSKLLTGVSIDQALKNEKSRHLS